jgi:hypothetical protein
MQDHDRAIACQEGVKDHELLHNESQMLNSKQLKRFRIRLPVMSQQALAYAVSTCVRRFL